MVVNIPKWDFGRLLGIYIAVFFVMSQVLSVIVFHETLRVPTVIAGILIASGGIVLTIFWCILIGGYNSFDEPWESAPQRKL